MMTSPHINQQEVMHMAFPLCPSTAGWMKLSDGLMHTSNNILRMISQAEHLPHWSPGGNGRPCRLGVITSHIYVIPVVFIVLSKVGIEPDTT